MEPTTTTATETITCTKPGCGNTTTLAESGYIDGCGQVCLTCFGPTGQDTDREPPF